MSIAPLASSVDRIPPNNLEAEMALLGSILVDKEMMPAVSEIVSAVQTGSDVNTKQRAKAKRGSMRNLKTRDMAGLTFASTEPICHVSNA